jgi:hypothetical protein
MTERDAQTVLMKEIQTRLEKKVRESEIEILGYWKEQLDRVASMKPEGIAALQMQVKRISEMMANRIRILKRD